MERTVWLLTRGEYSDYSVEAVFESKDAIDRVLAFNGTDEWGNGPAWNAPEECQIIDDPGVPIDVLHIRLQRVYNRDQIDVTEWHTFIWPWQDSLTPPKSQGRHFTPEEWSKDVAFRSQSHYSKPADSFNWLTFHDLALSEGTDHERVRKSFSEHEMQALDTLSILGIPWTKV